MIDLCKLKVDIPINARGIAVQSLEHLYILILRLSCCWANVQALRWQSAVRPLDFNGNNVRWPFASIRMLLEIHPFKDEFSLHLYIHKQQLTKSASRTTELVNQVPK